MFSIHDLNSYVKNIMELLVFRIIGSLAMILPSNGVVLLGDWIGYLCARVFKFRKIEVQRHLTIAFPEKGCDWKNRISLKSYRHLARESLVFLGSTRLNQLDIRDQVRIEGLESLERALQQGSGVMVVSGHLGNWEIGAAALAERGIPLDVVVQDQRNHFVDKSLLDLRRRMGIGVITVQQGPYAVLNSLRNGRVTAWLGDQSPMRSSVAVNLFGIPVRALKGPALLALRSGASIFFASSTVIPNSVGRYRVELKNIPVTENQNVKKMVRELTQTHTKLLELAIRRNPDQYLWHHRRWKNRN